MDDLSESQRLILEESERRPNRYTSKALAGVLVALLAGCLLNELGVFEVDRATIWACFAMAVAACAIAQVLARVPRLSVHPASKYIILSIALLLTLSVTTFLNSNVTLLFVLPMLLATQYRSMGLSWLAVAGSAVCCILSPVFSWLAHAWGLKYMTGFIETVCRVSITTGAPTITDGEAIFNLLVYLALPQFMVVVVFGTIILAITRASIQGLRDRVQVMELSDELNQELTRVVSIQDQILSGIADIIENRDNATGGHVKRTSEVVRILVEAMRGSPEFNLPAPFWDAVVKAAPLHDLGKIAVDDAILRKPGRLTSQEAEIIRQHPVRSAEIIRGVLREVENEEFISIAVNLAMYHHEWFDGTGYPCGLRGAGIPLEARIMAVADVYDALVSRRSYKDPIPFDRAAEIIGDLMGTQFDPALGRYFRQVLPHIQAFYTQQGG